jgi:hypothetical protein
MVASAYLIGGVLVLGAGAYEGYKHFFAKHAPDDGGSGKHTHDHAPAPDGTPDASASAAQVGVPGAASPPAALPVPGDGSGSGSAPVPSGGPVSPPQLGTPVTGRNGPGIDPAFLAKHPGWIGWHTGQPVPPSASRRRPLPPGVRRPVTHTGALLVGGAPVMTGAAPVDMAHLLAWHGYRRTDVPIYKRAQAMLRVPADGLPGPTTMSALQAHLAQRGIPMPHVPVFSFHAFDGRNGPNMKDWAATV